LALTVVGLAVGGGLWLLPLAAAILAILAQARVRQAYRRYSRVATRSRLTGAEVARLILDSRGLSEVEVSRQGGLLTDHYDPNSRTLRLSEQVHSGVSIASVGIAAHEAGHALQHADAYRWLNLRSSLVPVVGIGSRLAGPLFGVGVMLMMFSKGPLAIWLLMLAAYGLAGVVVFSLVTLPVEIDASARALRLLRSSGILDGEEVDGAAAMLRAAAYTYVAAAAVAILQLVHVLRWLAHARGGRSRS